ncbi:uncharacterized protein B0T15DRAFT_385628 [Chaetomium strumarium]|uniref:DUF8004 domain-containing protein n=1 Tax=Chaetomium strumarium TaxID=1170767 RepID=A0AAJ0H194_9PEZI|nr:hypothetical protein B0T15DRAFT_385628 [Chaetomium strumarium]
MSRLGLLTSYLPKLTSRADSHTSSSEAFHKPIPDSSTSSSTSPTSTVPTMATSTARTSEASESSSRLGAGTESSCLSPIDAGSPFSEQGGFFERSTSKLQKAPPAMPLSPPPPPPTARPVPSRTPPRIPDITGTDATPTPPTESGPGDRSRSPDRPPTRAKLQPARLQTTRLPSPAPNPRGRSVSAQPPPAARGMSVEGSRAVSSPVSDSSRLKPPSEGSPPAASERKKRKSWFPGIRSRANSDANKPKGHAAWILSPDNQLEYNTTPLVHGEKVPELWNESGNVYVYLHPKDSGRGPCFKVADHMFSLSGVLNELLVSEMMAGMSHDAGYADVAPEAGPVTEGHLYLPLENTDLGHLVAARNLFALLTHQPLVGTPENPTYFSAILQIAGLLRRFNFSSYDGSSFGESVDAAFDFFVDQVGLADVRHSREKTLEALILAEQMKSWNLYNEAFVHAVGKYESLMELKSPLYERISVNTRKRLERAHLDLANRQASLNTRLEAFEFPSLFAGTASSTSMEEYKSVRFKEWRNSYSRMRSFVLSYYKDLFGNWPPRARSRKNYFSQSGLNRECLKILYSDFCALYDLLVDRHALTPRVIGETYDQPDQDAKDSKDSKESKEKKLGEAQISALRKVLSEFDKSSPPVLPPIPFDVPKIPSMTAIYENYNELPAKKQAKYSRSIRPHELQLILLKSRNIDTDALQFPFLLAYKDFELREAKGVSPQDLADQRLGYWLFLYVVLQSLPMLVVDAPGLRYTEGVEDFLCEAPQGNPPWTEEAGEVRKIWYQTADQNIVELSADVVMFSVEGIYMRSHCWLAAKEWEAALDDNIANGNGAIPPSSLPPPAAPQLPDLQTSPLQPPRPAFRDMDPMMNNSNPPSRSQSPANSGSPSNSPHLRPSNGSPHLRPRSGSVNDRARQAFRASMAIGLEPLPLPPPAGVHHFDRTSRVLSSGSLASMSIRSRNGSPGPGPGSPVVGPGSPVSGGPWEGYQLGLRASRSAVNLNGAGAGGGGSGELFLNAAQQQQQPRKSSYGGFPGSGPGPSSLGPGAGAGAHHGASDSNGGSTFDDILKGMDNGKKKKKSLFF